MNLLNIILSLILAFEYANGQTIYDKLSTLNATTFLSIVNKTGMVQQLSSQGPWTVLVPTNAAFAKIPAHDLSAVVNDVNKLTEVLKYHIVSGRHYTKEFLFIKHHFLKSTNGHVLRVHRNSHGMFFNQAKAVQSNINATNGVIFLIDEVLDVPEGTVTDILANPGYNVSKFLQIVKLTGLDRQYSIPAGLNRYTMFAPNDAAIDALPSGVQHNILTDSAYAAAFVEYHVHSGTMHASTVAKYRSIRTTYPGHSLSVNHLSDGSLKLNNVAQILLPDIEAENGVVHVISHALIPPPDGIVG